MQSNQKLFMPIEHAGLRVGYLAEGFGLTMREMGCENANITAHSIYNNSRDFSVHVDGEVVGRVHYISGGRYIGVDLENNEVSNLSGPDAEIRCFAEVARTVLVKSNA